MFQVDSYLMKPKCNVTDLKDVVNDPQSYFVEVTDSAGLQGIYNSMDFQYLNGAICLKYYGESMLDMRYWDLVDQLWAYIMNLIDAVLQKGEGSEITSFVLPKNDFLIALIQGAEQFFTCMTNSFSSDCDYSYELERIERLKRELQ
ncbi:hypothetical protein SAMN04487969_1349 [Paenibacillus algorifonticola]|uniref:Uncharacterized protein n=1 Tax=Paenibacillus algorifonticola TaxID=684063 RepID=A0A1I2IEU4_9BACL|nr:hypothetical protein [Paenibacillus algorifonticola]SFF40163.1 hypothetical protein SAMN04487969_1349 [Paenibacillus algorifonticola]